MQMDTVRFDRIIEEIDSNAERLQGSDDGEISHLAIDIGGSLIKMVYVSSNNHCSTNDQQGQLSNETVSILNGNWNHSALCGSLHFVKFETRMISKCIKFLSSKKLQYPGGRCHELHTNEKIIIKATGGGAFKFADLFKEKLGITLDKVDEMDCLVAGANFLLESVHQEAFTYMDGKKEYQQIDQNDLYPYLLVNIGSGVSMIKVDGENKFERVSGTSIGGGTFWGLGKLLTKCNSFDELLELSHRGNNRVIDMLVGDIYGTDYSKIGLASTAIASSFGKAISENKELEEWKPEDIARSLLRMISNNIGQIAYLNALRYGLKRIFFGGFFIRGHAYTMDTISVAVDFWSKSEMKAMFLLHEGFLGPVGAFMNYKKDDLSELMADQLKTENHPRTSCGEDRLQTSSSVDQKVTEQSI
ncbi:PREDICTED: pantothenate kinase 1-like [Ipomoea nil]|uniref:pantothenate kinase 1-like n=1 Tax=Ipomoea nil TaxID=35883 RepID=UPI000900E5E7|nr:PREDICTED: pantothenate kinase 1-like [Ipomoea nil]